MKTGTPRRTTRWLATLGAASMLFAVAPSAEAARVNGSDFSCRASAVRVALAGQTLLEPVVANTADTPCADGTAAIISPTDIGPVRLNVANADTALTPDNLAAAPVADGDNAAAMATVTNPVVDLQGIRLTADAVGATVTTVCRAGQAVPAGNSFVADIELTIAGQATPIVIPAGNEPFTLDLPLGLGTLLLNQTVTENGRTTQRALELRLPTDSSIANVVVGEASVGLTGNPCDPNANPPATPECSDTTDNDGDGRIDRADPGCLSGPNGTFNPADNDESDPSLTAPAGQAECSDNRDNDGDGRNDAQDPGCLSGPNGAYNPTDNDERDAGNIAQCFDFVDNDRDGRIDFPRDPGCASFTDRTERTSSGTSRLTTNPSSIARLGTNGRCTSRSFGATVRGRSIRSVVFSVDGRRVRTDRSSPFTARISTTKAGRHRVSARVTFASDARTRARTLSFSFRRCSGGRPPVRFTG